jgi:hypothetical protein
MSRENEATGAPPREGSGEVDSGESVEQRAEHLQAEVEAARDDLGDLVGELDRRRHRAAKPLVVGAIAVLAVGLGGYLWWRARRSRPAAHRRPGGPSAAKKIVTAAAAAVASVAGRRAAERWTSRAAS